MYEMGIIIFRFGHSMFVLWTPLYSVYYKGKKKEENLVSFYPAASRAGLKVECGVWQGEE